MPKSQLLPFKRIDTSTSAQWLIQEERQCAMEQNQLGYLPGISGACLSNVDVAQLAVSRHNKPWV